MSKLYLTIIGILLCASTFETMEAQPASTVSDTLELNRIVITASKIPLTQRETTKPVLIIDRQEIERNGSRNIGQLLNQQSGIRVNDSFGSPANPQSLFMQGASAQFTLILIDGLAVNDPSGSGGTFDLRLLSLNNVERIEVLKGSQSTLYGTDAIAGVINIITKSGGTNTVNGTGQLSYGSYNSFEGSAGLNGSPSESFSYTLNYKRESSDGFSAAADPENTGTFGDDGFDSDSFYGKVEITPVEGLTISPFLNFNDFDGEFDNDAFQDADNEFTLSMLNPGVQLDYEFDKLQLNGGYNFIKTERTFTSQFGENDFDGTFHNIDLFGTYELTNYVQLLTGINYQQSEMPGNESEDELNSQITSPYATLFLKNLKGFSAEAGFRVNIHSEYGNNSTYSFAPSYHITDNLKLFGSVTTGFKAPTLSELFGPFGANADLDPQTSRYLSAGAETYLLNQSLNISALYFDRKIDDLIVFTFDRGFINRDKQNDSGFELSTSWIATNKVRLGAYYNYVDGELTTVDNSGNEVRRDNLIRKPTHSLGANIGVNVTENLLFRLEGEFNSDRADLFFDPENNFAEEEVTLDSYTLINLYAEYALINNQITIFSDIRNLFDSEFTEVFGFQTAGFTMKGGLRLNF